MLKLPTKKSSDLFGDISSIDVFEPDAVNGNVNNDQMKCIIAVVKKFNPNKIFEFGTFDGRTTLNLAAHSNVNSKIFTLDLPIEKLGKTVYPVEGNNKQYVLGKSSERRFHKYSSSRKIEQLWGDSATFDFNGFCRLHGPIDMVFVDACHSKEYAINDSKKAKLLTAGSYNPVIVWHDYGRHWEGVNEALDYLYLNDSSFKRLLFLDDVELVILA